MKVLIAFVSAALLCASSGAAPADGMAEPNPIPGGFTYAVALRFTSDSGSVRLCAASRIAGNWFVTAAECLERLNNKSGNLTITFPNPTFTGEKFSQLTVDASSVRFVNNPDYNPRTKDSNIGIFTVNSKSLPAETVVPQLPDVEDDALANKFSAILPWDDKADSKDIPVQLIAVTSLLTKAACKKEYSFTTLAKDAVCANRFVNLKKNDAGAPVIVDNGKTTLAAIATTKMYPRTSPRNPIVLTSLNPYTKWIKEEIKKAGQQ